MSTPRVYVGTYAKYNAGSIAGMWIDLSKCDTYADFLSACKKAHKNERDPEFMIQDCEGFPDGLDCTDWLSEDDFNDVKAAMKDEAPAPAFSVIDYSEKAIAVTGDTRAIKDSLKELGGRFNAKLTCGPGWIFAKTKESAVRALLGGAQVQTEAATKPRDGGEKYVKCLDEWLSTIADAKDRDYYKKQNIGAIKLPEGYLVFGKEHIENRFCFADEGPEYEQYKHLRSNDKAMAEYFKSENLSELDRWIANLKDENKKIFVHRDCHDGTCYLEVPYYSWDVDECSRTLREITPEERKAVLAAKKWCRKMFEKRLDNYLKKYGVSKLHTWSYWRDA